MRTRYYIFLPEENPWWLKDYSELQKFAWQRTLLWLVVINKTIVQLKRIKSLHHNGNPLEQKRRCSNIHDRVHQSPAQVVQEEHPC